MSIEIGSKWVKYGEVVEVTNIISYGEYGYTLIWFSSKINYHVLTIGDFLEQYKPYIEPVYEYLWVTEERFGLHILDKFKTEKEMENFYGERKQRLDFTKRERKIK